MVDCNANFSVSICNREGQVYYGTNLVAERGDLLRLRGNNEFYVTFDKLNLLSGKYYVNVGLYNKQNDVLDEIKLAKSFLIHSDYDLKETGIIHVDHKWDMGKVDIISYE